jgi:hypothetical protein
MMRARLYSSSAGRRGIFFLLSVLLALVAIWKVAPTAHASGCGANFFTYTATASNTSGHITTIDSSLTNNLPNIRFEVSQLYAGAYDPHPLGVWYNSFAGRWTIFNEGTQPMPIGTAFSIREQPDTCTVLPEWKVYRHTATASDIVGDYTVIDNPVTNNNPDAAVEVTQEFTSLYNPHEVGAFYTGSRWAIFNEDGAAMPVGASFDLSVGQALKTSYQQVYAHTATASNTSGSISYLTASVFTNPGILPRVTQAWNSGGACGCVFNPHAVGLWYDPGAGRWSIYNVDVTPIPLGAKFFISTI